MELNTYGDLKKVIKAITLKQKGEKLGNVALGALMGLIPGADAAKSTFDFIKAAISKPDAKKTNTWLDKLDIDDEMSAIVDDTVENGFMQMMTKTIELKPDNESLADDFNMNNEMVNYLKKTYQGRTVSGVKENKMDKSTLRFLIREAVEQVFLEKQSNPTDKIILDVPLFIRMLEYAREDAQTDMDLHDVTEKAIALSASGKTLTMADYNKIVNKK